MSATPLKNPKILVGRFGAPQGIKGEIRIKTYTADPLAIGGYGVLSDCEGAGYEILRARALQDDMIVASIKNLTDRDQAKNLTGRALYVDRDKLPAPNEDEFYICDLIGLKTVSPEGESLGRLVNVLNYGAGDILEIKPESGEVFLVAFTKANAPSIDFETGRMTLIRPVENE